MFLKKYKNENHNVYEVLGLKFKIKNKLDIILDEIKNVKRVTSDFEIGRCKNIYNNIDKKIFLEKYKNLVSGLDEESIRQISTIIARIIKISKSDIYEDVFTEEEVIQIKKLEKEFKNNIIELNENCYAYKQYILPINHFEKSVFYYKHSINELENSDKIKNKNIIDVGGFIGDSAIVLKDYTDCKVYSFEPETNNIELMYKTIELNNAQDKIIPIKCGLGSKEEQQEIYSDGSGSVLLQNTNAEMKKETINITTLDKFVEENNIEVGLIKVDIEGFEPEFLKGAVNTIKNQKPTLLLSIYHNAHDLFELKPYIESLNLNYKLKIRKPVDGSVRGEILLIAE